MRVLIADDEPLARERVESFLVEENDIEVVAQASNGPEAGDLIRELRPDLVFFDVQMPGADGLNVFRSLPPAERPLVIFITAYGKYAVDAFEVQAVDYLLKPLKAGRFKDSLSRARALLRKGPAETAARAPAAPPEAKVFLSRIPVRQNGRVTFVPVREITHVEAAGNYLTLHTTTERHMVRETLSNLEGQLAPGLFVRISRSALVNVNAIKEIQPSMPGEHVMLLRNGRSLPVTRGLRELEELLRFA